MLKCQGAPQQQSTVMDEPRDSVLWGVALKLPFTRTQLLKPASIFPAYSHAPVILNPTIYLLWNNQPTWITAERRTQKLVISPSFLTTQTVVNDKTGFTCSHSWENRNRKHMDSCMPTDRCWYRIKKKKEKKEWTSDIKVITFSNNTNKHEGRSAKNWKGDKKIKIKLQCHFVKKIKNFAILGN